MTFDTREGLKVAFVGALVATSGDVLLLYVSSRASVFSGAHVPTLLLVGSVLGVLGIACYAFGYRARAMLASPGTGTRWTKGVEYGGTLFAAWGSTVHAATGLLIAANPSRETGLDPYHAILQSGPIVLSLWALASIAFLATTLPELKLCLGWSQRAVNPLVLTLTIVVVSELFPPFIRNIIGPASVNAAHVFFFAFYLSQVRRAERQSK